MLQAVKKEMVAKMQMIGLSLERNMFQPPVRKKIILHIKECKKKLAVVNGEKGFTRAKFISVWSITMDCTSVQ